MVGNIITASFYGGKRASSDRALWQYDYGITLQINGLPLPPTYEVHFANARTGTSVTQIGNENGVFVPDVLLTKPKTILCWIFLHVGNDDGETRFEITIPVLQRAKPSSTPPTPVQQDVIEQAIAALNTAVEQTGADVVLADASASAAVAAAELLESPSATATTLPTGSEATASYSNGVFSFGLPRGEQGEQGPAGQTGPAGPQGETGPAGPQGEQGIQGEQGPAGTVPDFSIGTVETLSAGSSATASITGTTEAPVLNLGIPKGDKGEQGIQGIQGPQGIQGETGPQGPQGETGATGATGATGPQGPQGIQGIQGPQGEQGPQGDDYVLTAQDKEDIAALVGDMLTVTVSGTDPVINGVANTRYICGTVSTISITPPQSGIIDVLFTSGSSVAVVTLPNTVKMPDWYEVQTERIYEINIMDGVYGSVMSWHV